MAALLPVINQTGTARILFRVNLLCLWDRLLGVKQFPSINHRFVLSDRVYTNI